MGITKALSIASVLAPYRETVDVLERRMSGFRAQLDDSAFNFAVNDEMFLSMSQARFAERVGAARKAVVGTSLALSPST